MAEIRVSHDSAQDQLDGLGEIPQGVDIPKNFIGADGSFEGPSVDDVLKALEGLSGLSIEDRDALKTQLLQQKMRESMGEYASESWSTMPSESFIGNDFMVLFAMIILIGSVFAFFGLKLYRSLVERERKREEKRKLKMQKKKK